MDRLPCIVIPGYPHPVTQRSNRRAQKFFEDGDYELYRAMDRESAVSFDAQGLLTKIQNRSTSNEAEG